ncbi:MAG: heme-binding domain-containing protein [Planctomycetota bacterium]
MSTEDPVPSPRTKVVRWVLASLVGALVLIQLIPVDRSNPPVEAEPAWDSARTKELAQRACLDCHGNETRWPWYSRVAPASWLVAYDVHEGRREMNLSLPNPRHTHEAAEELEEGEMPPKPYLLLHPEARLSADEKAELARGLRATFGGGRERD